MTALEIASTPVKEEAPEEKAFNSKNNVTPGTAVPTVECICGCTSPIATRYVPTIINTINPIMNK